MQLPKHWLTRLLDSTDGSTGGSKAFIYTQGSARPAACHSTALLPRIRPWLRNLVNAVKNLFPLSRARYCSRLLS